MTILKDNSKVIRNLSGEILTSSDAIVDIDIDYNYVLNGSNIKYMKNRSNPSRIIYQRNTARQPIYNAAEKAGECDMTNMELYLPRLEELAAFNSYMDRAYSIYFKIKLKDITSSRYILEVSDGGALKWFIQVVNDIVSIGKTIPYEVTTNIGSTALDYFEFLISCDGTNYVSFINGVLNKKDNQSQVRQPYLIPQVVIFGNTRISSLKFNGYFKAFKLWDRAILNPDNYTI